MAENSRDDKTFDPSQEPDHGRLASVGKKRTRTGCLNCRRKRRKCDETKPTCEGCQARKETCEWGVRVSFRPENAQTMGPEHPSMLHAPACPRNQSFQIINVTAEVIRDYLEESVNDDLDYVRPVEATPEHWGRAATQAPVNHDPAFGSTALKEDDSNQHPSPVLPRTGASHDATPVLPGPDMFLSPQWSDSAFEDGIFLPGSQYQDLHAELRSHIISTARSTFPSRISSPLSTKDKPALHRHDSLGSDDEESRRLADLTVEQEYVLWQNYINEVAPWLDKFDNGRHFELVLPIMAKSHSHIRYSILALSARQVELKSKKTDNSCSLSLYQHAIHLLLPLLQQRSTPALASCVVLCVLEMMSCSPKAWRRHLDGCAALIQALGLNGGCGGLEQALFWCFARMDVCGGLISSERTLIPMDRWMGTGDIVLDCATFQSAHVSFDMYANHIVYLCGQIVDLLCSSGKWEQRHRIPAAQPMDAAEYIRRWSRIFELLEMWYQNRPEAMKALFTISSPSHDGTRPFQTLFYGNGPATSGNQMYHTAALLMLKFKPSHIHFAKKPASLLWHARQICAISLSNNHHGCWTNSVQPLWIAGQHMSHPSEHRAILEILEKIERETGWATKWRAEDLKEYWGELDN